MTNLHTHGIATMIRYGPFPPTQKGPSWSPGRASARALPSAVPTLLTVTLVCCFPERHWTLAAHYLLCLAAFTQHMCLRFVHIIVSISLSLFMDT